MPIETGLRTLLLAESTISTLLGEATKGVYVTMAPQNAVEPFVLITVLNMDPYLHLGTTSGLRASEIDIDCKAKTDTAARALANAVETYIDDFSGTAGSDTINGVLLRNRTAEVEPPDGKLEYGRFVETIDVTIQWTPA